MNLDNSIRIILTPIVRCAPRLTNFNIKFNLKSFRSTQLFDINLKNQINCNSSLRFSKFFYHYQSLEVLPIMNKLFSVASEWVLIFLRSRNEHSKSC